jgi:signal transduction histidine kinase
MRRLIVASAICSCLLFLSALPLQAADGTATEARAMLDRAATAVKADKTTALGQFVKGENGFKDRDLYVFCVDLDGKFVAHPNPALMGHDGKTLKDGTGKAFVAEMLTVAQDGKVAQVDYMFPRPGTKEPAVPKSSYVTKVADLVCGVGYYK